MGMTPLKRSWSRCERREWLCVYTLLAQLLTDKSGLHIRKLPAAKEQELFPRTSHLISEAGILGFFPMDKNSVHKQCFTVRKKCAAHTFAITLPTLITVDSRVRQPRANCLRVGKGTLGNVVNP